MQDMKDKLHNKRYFILGVCLRRSVPLVRIQSGTPNPPLRKHATAGFRLNNKSRHIVRYLFISVDKRGELKYNIFVDISTKKEKRTELTMDRFNKFTISVNRIVRNIHKIKAGEMSKFGLKSTHVSCLYYLYRAEKPLTASELTVVCDEDKAAISRAADYLTKEGFVTCKGTGLKKYKSPLFLTEKGKEAGESVAERVDAIIDAAGGWLSEDDREIFYKSLDIISDNLQKMCDSLEKD